jgi:hypothetical protein
MKNLTDREVQVRRNDNTRDRYPASATVPSVVDRNILTHIHVEGAVPVIIISKIDFGNLVLNHSDGPFIVTAEVLEHLHMQHGHFVTPDLGPTAIRNALGGVHAVTRFITRPVQSVNEDLFFDNLQSIKN